MHRVALTECCATIACMPGWRRIRSCRNRVVAEGMSWLLKRLWALPCSLVGVSGALLIISMGGRTRWRDGALEVTHRDRLALCGARARALPFRAIVFGHVILAVSAEELQHVRLHEQVHVAQYERWGPVFLLAYPAASLWQWLRGGHPYRDNAFEVQARKLGG